MEAKIRFKNTKDDNLSGVLLISNNRKKSPIIIITTGLSSNKEGTAKKIADKLNLIGINSFRFDFWGHGESDGKFEDITISEGVDNILSAINYLDNKGYTNMGLLGNSFGGTCAIIASSKTDKLKALGLFSPVADYSERTKITMAKEQVDAWRKNGYRIYKSGDGREWKLKFTFYKDFINNKGFNAAKKIKIPTCIVHGNNDKDVPIQLSQKLANILSDKEFHVIEGADHRYTNVALMDLAIDFLVRFFQSKMKALN